MSRKCWFITPFVLREERDQENNHHKSEKFLYSSKNAKISSTDLIDSQAVMLQKFNQSVHFFGSVQGDQRAVCAAMSSVRLVRMWVLPQSLLNDGWRRFVALGVCLKRECVLSGFDLTVVHVHVHSVWWHGLIMAAPVSEQSDSSSKGVCSVCAFLMAAV